MDMARDMEKHVSSTSWADLLGPSTSSCSSKTKREDKSSRSMNVDMSPNSMEICISLMQQFMKQQTIMMQMMQEKFRNLKEYPTSSYEQPHKCNNNYECRRNFNKRPRVDQPKQSNAVREESTALEREKCSYSLDHEEEKDNVHVLTEEYLDALFVADKVQPFTVLKEGLQQIFAHSTKVDQREIVQKFDALSEVGDEPSIENIQQYHRGNPNNGKQPYPWESSYFPINPKPTPIPSTSQSNDNVSKIV